MTTLIILTSFLIILCIDLLINYHNKYRYAKNKFSGKIKKIMSERTKYDFDISSYTYGENSELVKFNIKIYLYHFFKRIFYYKIDEESFSVFQF